MKDASDLASMMPGFDFLQGLMKNAGAAMPGMGQWITPTLDPDEIEKRIKELRTVQFWLEQNARLLRATIQALEVQRMTLSTLRTMNLPLSDLGDALRIKPQAAPAAPAPAPQPEPAPAPAVIPADPPAAAAAAAAGAVDPMQWWGALTRQFTEIASQAMQDAGNRVPPEAAGAPAAKPMAATRPARKAPARKRNTAPRSG